MSGQKLIIMAESVSLGSRNSMVHLTVNDIDTTGFVDIPSSMKKMILYIGSNGTNGII
jgi:hypothetical protein